MQQKKTKKQFPVWPQAFDLDTPSNTTVFVEEEGPKMQVLVQGPARDSFQLEE